MTQPRSNGRFSAVLLASDFDGTLFSSKTGMPSRNVEAARYFIQEGGTFTIATGRTYKTFAPHTHIIPHNAPTILSNGAGVYDFQEDTLISITNLPDTVSEDLKTLCAAMPSLGFEAYHETDIYAFRPNHITDLHMEIVGAQYTELPIQDIPTPWLKVLIQQERDILLEARERLQKIRPNTYETIFSNPRYLEVTAKDVNKGAAVLRLAQQRGISSEHIYCVGDNENDLPLLSLSKIPFAPSSSAEVVLETKPQLLCPCQEGVLGDLISVLEGIYPEK